MKRFISMHSTWSIFLAALSLRLIGIVGMWIMHWHPTPLEHEVIISNFFNGKGFSYSHLGTVYMSFINPLYTFLCIMIYKIFGHYHLPIILMQSTFSAFVCVSIYYIGSLIDKKVGLFAAMLTMLHPGIFYYDLFYLHGLSMDALLFALIILMFMRLCQNPSFLNQIGAGVALGLQMYERGTIALFIIPAFIWLYYFQALKESMSRLLKKCIMIMIVIGLLMAPWAVRNFIIHKEFVLVCTTLSEVLWRGNNPLATGTAYSTNGAPMFFSAPKEFQDRIMRLDELGQMRAFREEAFKFIKESPVRFIALTLRKVKLFWWFSPLTGIEYKFKHLGLVKLAYATMVLFAVLSMMLIARKRTHIDLATLIIILFVTISFGQALFYVQQKHRWALEPLLFIFVGHGMLYIYSRFRHRP